MQKIHKKCTTYMQFLNTSSVCHNDPPFPLLPPAISLKNLQDVVVGSGMRSGGVGRGGGWRNPLAVTAAVQAVTDGAKLKEMDLDRCSSV